MKVFYERMCVCVGGEREGDKERDLNVSWDHDGAFDTFVPIHLPLL